jgi:hypothetical protein
MPLSGAQSTLASWLPNGFASTEAATADAKATNFNQLTVSLETYAFDSGIHFAPARNCKAAGVAAR